MRTAHPLDIARAEAANEMSDALVAAAAAAMKRHGCDPDADGVLAVGFALALAALERDGRPAFAAIVAREAGRALTR